jgi:hypothetical protein
MTKDLSGFAVSISRILKFTFLKSLLFKIAKALDKTCQKLLVDVVFLKQKYQ